jgi:hypothetical protein
MVWIILQLTTPPKKVINLKFEYLRMSKTMTLKRNASR